MRPSSVRFAGEPLYRLAQGVIIGITARTVSSANTWITLPATGQRTAAA